MRRRRRRDAGFTLPEALIAGTLTLFLALPALHFVLKTQAFGRALESRFRLNAEARQVFALLGDGSAVLDTTGTLNNPRGFPYVEGLRSRQTAPAGSTLRSASQFVFPDGPSFVLQGDSFPPLAVPCAGARNPLPDCTATETKTVQGWLGSDPSISVSNRNAAVSFQVTDPFQATARNVVPGSATERYRTIFYLNVDAAP